MIDLKIKVAKPIAFLAFLLLALSCGEKDKSIENTEDNVEVNSILSENIEKNTVENSIKNSTVDLNIPIEELLGKGNPTLHGKDFKLRKEAADSLNKLITAARKEGFKPWVVSSYRNYNHQKRIWDNKYVKFTKEEKLSPEQAIKKIVLYSTIPGTSRHHWGTDFDIIDAGAGEIENPLSAKHFAKDGAFYKFKLWLNDNAEKYGFYEVYTNSKGRKGFNYEPWHFSFKKLSVPMLEQYKQEHLIENVNKSDIQGATKFKQEFIDQYYQDNILDINPALLP